MNAIGIYADDHAPPPVDLSLYDFLIAKVGNTFHNNVQRAYDIDIPCILFADHQVLKWHVDFTLNKDKWPEPEQEPLIKLLDQMIYSNGVKRAIHGIMLDTSYVTDDENGALTWTWYIERTRWMLDMVYVRYNLPLYLYQNKTPINTYSTGDGYQAVIMLLRDYGVSTIDISEATEPDLPYNDTGWDWHFWLYKTNPLTMQFNGTPERLETDHGYTPHGEVEPPAPPPEYDWLAGLADWVASVESRLAQQQGGSNYEERLSKIEEWIRKSHNI